MLAIILSSLCTIITSLKWSLGIIYEAGRWRILREEHLWHKLQPHCYTCSQWCNGVHHLHPSWQSHNTFPSHLVKTVILSDLPEAHWLPCFSFHCCNFPLTGKPSMEHPWNDSQDLFSSKMEPLYHYVTAKFISSW